MPNVHTRPLPGRLALAACATLWLAGCSLTKPEEEPAYIKATAVEERVDRIERQNQALLDLQRRLEAAEADIRRLRGDLEELAHQSQAAKDQQRDLYADLDKRLAAIDARLQAGAAAPAAPPAGGTPSDHDAYQAAQEKLKSRDFAGAEQAFKDFLTSYPQSTLVDNAIYWLGETYYVEGRFPDALGAFERLIHDYPDSRKLPDALLKAGYTQDAQKRYREAREYLARLVRTFPDSPVAADARERLKRMDAEHH